MLFLEKNLSSKSQIKYSYKNRIILIYDINIPRIKYTIKNHCSQFLHYFYLFINFVFFILHFCSQMWRCVILWRTCSKLKSTEEFVILSDYETNLRSEKRADVASNNFFFSLAIFQLKFVPFIVRQYIIFTKIRKNLLFNTIFFFLINLICDAYLL